MFKLFKRSSIPNIKPEEFEQILRTGEQAILLDVRTKSEYESGHIPNAVNINLQSMEFKKRIKELDRSAKYLVYCRSGRRSMAACKAMHHAGIKNTINLKGGILKWHKEIV